MAMAMGEGNGALVSLQRWLEMVDQSPLAWSWGDAGGSRTGCTFPGEDCRPDIIVEAGGISLNEATPVVRLQG